MIILEKSLTRIMDHIENHDTAMITAYRSDFVKKDNQKRNESLLAKLQAKRYGVTSVKGSYIENYGTPDEKEVGEHVFFTVDLSDTGKLKEDIIKLGLEFDQDSILFIPKGGKEGLLIGTSKRDNSYPGYNKVIKLSNPVFGKGGEFSTKVRNRPFVFESVVKAHDYELPSGFFGRMSCKKISEMNWEDLE